MIWNTNLRWRLPVVCLLLEVVMIALFGVFVRYDMDADPHWVEEKAIKNLTTDLENEFYYRYPSKSRHLAGPLCRSPYPGGGSCLASGGSCRRKCRPHPLPRPS